jgi:hypothetical protein
MNIFEEFDQLIIRMELRGPVDLDDFERFLELTRVIFDMLPPEEVRDMAAPFVPDAIKVLREIANNPNASEEDRRAAIESLIEKNIPLDPKREWRH